MIKIYAAGTSGECSELPGRFSDAADVEQLYARFCERFPQVGQMTRRPSGQTRPEAVVTFIGQRYMTADPALDAIPPQTDTGYDSWCPRRGDPGLKYWDRVPLSAMSSTGYFNCLYATALTARALSQTGSGFSLLVCTAVPTHPYVQLADRPGCLFSFHHDGLRQYHGHVEIRDTSYTPDSLIPISGYGTHDGIYGLSIPEHFLTLTRLVPAAGNAERAISAFDALAASLDSYPPLARVTDVIRRSVIPRLRSGPVPFARTIEDGYSSRTGESAGLCGYSESTGGSTTPQRPSSTRTGR